MGKIKDLTGSRFGRLVVFKLCKERTKNKETKWICNCDCKNQTIASRGSLLNGYVKSCGCLRRENSHLRKHGMINTRTYNSWVSMRARVNDTKHARYKDYGGRGISVCDRWNSFQNFLEDMGERPDSHSLDRIDVDGDYKPDNCRWTTDRQQSNNRRDNVYIEYNNTTYTMSELCAELNLDYKKFWKRFRYKKLPLADCIISSKF